MVQFRLLGPLEAQDGERRVELGRPKQRAVLAALLVHANHVVSLDRLVEELRGAEPPPQTAASLPAEGQWALFMSHLLRSELGPAQELGAELITLGSERHDPALVSIGHCEVGTVALFRGTSRKRSGIWSTPWRQAGT